MSMQDPISDMIVRIHNGQNAYKNLISMPSSKMKISIANILKNEGFIKDYECIESNKPILILKLKYFKGKPVIEMIKRISKPGLRIYKKSDKLPKVMDGMGIVIISTSKGIITDKKARKSNIGGEIICYVS
ncbi:30S ribosomal protein S8 [Sodalis-like secondary symbiont of Drepanosiphum platanoidis]|uniref:30S ribosomal protein S8 n=1 Tax=Sodalis-like secondary symbiont of Drepanosiphum platanoidis TaxID=2994493 RepID=UPI003463F0F8